MRIQIIYISLLILQISATGFAQEYYLTKEDLKQLSGCWDGSLTYLDYSTNKPFSMPSNYNISPIEKSDNFKVVIAYPKEPEANSIDTIFITGNGNEIDGEIIKSKRVLSDKSLEIITEQKGKDGNDDKPATFKFTYLLSAENYSKKKEVKFDDGEAWIMRHEYKFKRCKD